MSQTEPGRLYVVATPIGNLNDITQRAVSVLTEVDLILCEDTRHTRKLLSHFSIDNHTQALHDHNEKKRAAFIISKLQQGQSIALVSDAGTPLISDPGYTLVNECRQAELDVITVPGACAAIAALSVAGLPTDRFMFEGFLPVKTVAKLQVLSALADEPRTTVFYESPRRILDTLSAIAESLGESRKVVVARELTKTFETVYQGTVRDVLALMSTDENHRKGEFVLMIAGADIDKDALPAEAIATLKLLMTELPLKKAAAFAAEIHGVKKNALYKLGLTF